jgi:hypothetical protein
MPLDPEHEVRRIAALNGFYDLVIRTGRNQEQTVPNLGGTLVMA